MTSILRTSAPARVTPGAMARFAASLACVGAVAWASMVGVLYLSQDDYVYAGKGGRPATMMRGWEKVVIPSPDGPLAAYHRAGAPGMPTVVFLHGNATSYAGVIAATRGFVDRGAGVLAPEYPGYAGNPGHPREAAINAAADRAYDWLVGQGVRGRDIILYGNSIGSGPAAHLARRPNALLLLVSPVGTMADVVRFRMPWVPAFLVHDAWRNDDAARQAVAPVVVVHARDDRVVPFEQGRMLAAASHGRFVALDGGGHQIAFDGAFSHSIADMALAVWRRDPASAQTGGDRQVE